MFRLEIETSNDAFQHGNADEEIARILTVAADFIRNGGTGTATRILRDINGNKVGQFQYFPED